MKDNNWLELKGNQKRYSLLQRCLHTTTAISENKFFVYGGFDNNDKETNSMYMIEIQDILLLEFHLIDCTGMHQL